SRSHAHLLYFVKNPDEFTFNANDPAIRVPSARQLVYGDKRANPNGRLPDDTWITPPVRDTLSDSVAIEDTDNGTPSPSSSEQNGGLTHEGWYLRPQDVPNGFAASGDVW